MGGASENAISDHGRQHMYSTELAKLHQLVEGTDQTTS